ncbi:MAG: VTT domain-containing protein [Bacteroidetes bacterium]|nr:VTT domain-containing protein [Bacteroidota bacterium]
MKKGLWLPFLISVAIVIAIFLLFPEAENYFQIALQNVKESKSTFSVWSFLILTSDIFLPVPSSIVMYFNGLVLGVIWGFLLSMFSVFLSSALGYYAGRIGAWGVKAVEDEKANAFMEKYGMLAILISRGIPVLSESICFVSGYRKFPFGKYMAYSVLGYLPVAIIYACFGTLGESQDLFLISFGASLLFSGLIYVAVSRWRK